MRDRETKTDTGRQTHIQVELSDSPLHKVETMVHLWTKTKESAKKENKN